MDVDNRLAEPIAMNEKPPSCFFGCCNVRSWTLFVSFLHISYGMIRLIYVFINYGKFPVVIYSAVTPILMIFLNIKLGRGVLKRNIVPILLWLRNCTIGFILVHFLMAVGLILTEDPLSYIPGKHIKEKFGIIDILCFDVLFMLVSYPVYQYYKFLRTSAHLR